MLKSSVHGKIQSVKEENIFDKAYFPIKQHRRRKDDPLREVDKK